MKFSSPLHYIEFRYIVFQISFMPQKSARHVCTIESFAVRTCISTHCVAVINGRLKDAVLKKRGMTHSWIVWFESFYKKNCSAFYASVGLSISVGQLCDPL